MLPPDDPMPYVFVEDDAFALTTRMLKPYPGVHDKGSSKRIFHYRLSRARRVVENVFGILASVFRIFSKPILLEPHHKWLKLPWPACCCTIFCAKVDRQAQDIYHKIRWTLKLMESFLFLVNGEMKEAKWALSHRYDKLLENRLKKQRKLEIVLQNTSRTKVQYHGKIMFKNIINFVIEI